MVEEESNLPEYRGFNNIDAFKESLQQVTTQLESIRTSFYQGVEEIERIKKMLDVSHLNKFSNIISEFEDRLTATEKEKEDAIESARKYSEELEKEKERLIKLWDAYKMQEDELAAKEKRITELEKELERREKSMKQLEEDLNKRINTLTERLNKTESELKEYEGFKKEFDNFEKIKSDLERKVGLLENELSERDNELRVLKSEVTELRKFKKYAEYKDKYNQLSVEYQKERDRLTKLYKLYEELEKENNKLKTELNRWHSWYDSNAEIFEKLFKSAADLRKSVKVKKEKTPKIRKKTKAKKTKKK